MSKRVKIIQTIQTNKLQYFIPALGRLVMVNNFYNFHFWKTRKHNIIPDISITIFEERKPSARCVFCCGDESLSKFLVAHVYTHE
jgi:hypothetical protein